MAQIISNAGFAPTIKLSYGETYTFGTGSGNVYIYAGETLPAVQGTFILPGDDTLNLTLVGPSTVISSGGNTINLGSGGFATVDAGPDDTITSGSGFPTINAADGDIINTGAGGALINLSTGTVTVNQANLFAAVTSAFPDVIAQAALSGPSSTTTGTGYTVTAPGLTETIGAEGQLNFLDGSINNPEDAVINAYYELALGRPVDIIGLGYAVAAIQPQDFPAGTLSSANTLFLADKTSFFQGIVGSAEFQAKYGSLSNAAFVDTLYQNSDTAEDAAGAAFWTGLLNAGTSKAAVLNGFAGDAINAIALTQTPNTYAPTPAAVSVTSLYETALGRAPDATGYANAIMAENAGLTPQELAQSLIGSAEFAGFGNTASSSAFVNMIQQVAYGSVSDTATAFWAQALDTGAITRGGVVAAYADSAAMTAKVGTVFEAVKLTGT